MGSICMKQKNNLDHDMLRNENYNFNENENDIYNNQEQIETGKYKSIKNPDILNQETNIQNNFGGEEFGKNNENEKYILNNYNNENNNNNGNNKKDETEYLVKTININSQIQKEEIIKNIQKDLLPSDDFSKYIFEQINQLRKNPKAFIPLFENAKSKIIVDKHERLIYKSNLKIALNKGKPTFDETIQFLEECEPMNELIFNPEMCVPLPENEEEIKEKNYTKNKVEEISKKVTIKSYWRDFIKEPESCFILMVVDDNDKRPGIKRKDLLNPNNKYIGISSIMINKSFACYITLSDK